VSIPAARRSRRAGFPELARRWHRRPRFRASSLGTGSNPGVGTGRIQASAPGRIQASAPGRGIGRPRSPACRPPLAPPWTGHARQLGNVAARRRPPRRRHSLPRSTRQEERLADAPGRRWDAGRAGGRGRDRDRGQVGGGDRGTPAVDPAASSVAVPTSETTEPATAATSIPPPPIVEPLASSAPKPASPDTRAKPPRPRAAGPLQQPIPRRPSPREAGKKPQADDFGY
jgi:hypothetical protein